MVTVRTNGCEWDDEKERDNRRRHKLAFDAAVRLLNADDLLEGIDDRFDYGEERIIAFGVVLGRVLCCVYTMRGARKRIISLRRANAKEASLYYENLGEA